MALCYSLALAQLTYSCVTFSLSYVEVQNVWLDYVKICMWLNGYFMSSDASHLPLSSSSFAGIVVCHVRVLHPEGWRYRQTSASAQQPSHSTRVPTLLLTKKIEDFSRTFQDPMKNFPGPFRSPRMFKYKKKMAFTYNIQSVVHAENSAWSKMCNTCCLFSIWTTRKMHDFQGYFSRTFQDQSDFPGLSWSWNFQEKNSRTFQDFLGGVGTLFNFFDPERR